MPHLYFIKSKWPSCQKQCMHFNVNPMVIKYSFFTMIVNILSATNVIIFYPGINLMCRYCRLLWNYCHFFQFVWLVCDLNRTPNCYGKTWRLLCPFFRNLHLRENLARDCFTFTASTVTNSAQNSFTRLPGGGGGGGGVLTIFWVTGRLGPFDPPFSTYVEFWPLLLGSDVEYWPPFFQTL